ncbi:MAG: cupredoxin domain-containing protein [Planctomycetes bacterium]|nr:cupredoxin domain-containing protein [Planctomycetota bacterium]
MKTLLLGIAACLLALGPAAAASREEHVVKITDKGFSPDRIEVAVGEKVLWKNLALKEHSVTAGVKPALPGAQGQEKPLFDSGPIEPGGTFEHTFTKEGSYEYRCTMQKGMTGTVIVKPAR